MSAFTEPIPAADRRRSLVDELQAVLDYAAGRPMTVGEIVVVLRHRGPAVVMLLLSLPFVIPVPTFGLSTPLGAAIMIYGVRMMLRRPAWVPAFVGRRTIPFAALDKVINTACRFGRRVEMLLRPRLTFMLRPAVDVPIGFSLAFCGFFGGLLTLVILTVTGYGGWLFWHYGIHGGWDALRHAAGQITAR